MAGVNEVIAKRLRALDQYVRELKAVQDITWKEFLDNIFVRKYVERTLHTAIEACLDIGRHLIAEEGFRFPDTNVDVFIVLKEEGVIPEKLFPILKDMVGFRNVLVHEYIDLDPSVVYGVLKKHLGDFEEFARAIISYLERNEVEDERKL